MARPKVGDELENLRKQQAELAERIKAAEAKQREREREAQQRREILAGRIVLAWIAGEREGATSRELIKVLNDGLTRKGDGALFDFLPGEGA